MNSLSKDQLGRINVFLNTLYTTKDNPRELKLHQLGKELGMPYFTNLPMMLYKKGIIEKKQNGQHHYLIQWVSKTEPNNHMRDALVSELRKYGRECYNRAYKRNHTTIQIHHQEPSTKPNRLVMVNIEMVEETVTPLVNIRTHINKMKDDLVSIGWSEQDAIKLIKQQIL